MATRAHHLALRDLVLQAVEAYAVAHELADVARLRPHVVELEDDRIVLAAVSAGGPFEDAEHVVRRSRAPGLERSVRLPTMDVAACDEVAAEACFAPVLPALSSSGERFQRQVALAAAASAR
ncbi:MAG: hypothetical protein R2736_16320 [Solirubrobacterales bacterium]